MRQTIDSPKQKHSISHSHSGEGETMTTFPEHISMRAEKNHVWEALADIGSIYRWNPGVVDSRLITNGDGDLGSKRYCNLGGKTYLNESATERREGEGLTMGTTGPNLPFKIADILFSLEQRDSQTFVTVSPTYVLKLGLLGRLLDVAFVRSQYRQGMANLLKGLKTVC